MAESIEENIKSRNSSIKSVKAYTKDDKIIVNIYLDKDIDLDEVISKYNSEVPRYERVSDYKVYFDSIDTRLKQ